ncbi:amino acid ABC transporter substrate-binding protein (PAAT family) [Aestuariispira insulae]|uniref:Amino acid ABC transporter substrate-binding protein (PAAT family) n=2 Tax=Aestuariispira insulae TaxID=1461337 RepID=A0A3D9HYA5_9PROT|nr:amino acid ABC transporter substrate-binding protein (PAAT family) [Aestuariispira insulae]
MAVVFLFIWISITGAEAREVHVVVGFDHDSRPFSFSDNGKATGLYPAIVREVFNRIHQPVSLKAYPWRRVLAGLETGQLAAGGIYRTAERDQVFAFSRPFHSDAILLFVPTERPKNNKFTLSDLTGMTIGAIQGWSYGDRFDHLRQQGLFRVEEVRNDASNLRKLQAGKLDAFLAVEIAGWNLLAETDNLDSVRSIRPPVAVNNVHLAFSNGDPNVQLLPAINQAIADMAEDGTLEDIFDRYIDPSYRAHMPEALSPPAALN